MRLPVTEGMMNSIRKMFISRSKDLVRQKAEERKVYRVMKKARGLRRTRSEGDGISSNR